MIPQKTNEAINKIIESAFNGNALFDNISYNLDVVFNMPVANQIVHENVAHWFPNPFADDIQTFQSQQGVKPIRPTVQSQTKTYSNVIDCFDDGIKYFNELEADFQSAIEIADSEKYISARIFLENKYLELLPFIKQLNIWHKKSIEYSENIGLQSFDIDFPRFTLPSIMTKPIWFDKVKDLLND